MVEIRDLTLLFGVLLITGTVIAASGAVKLPGSNIINDVFTQPDNTKETRYKLTTNVKVGPEGLKGVGGQAYGFKYKTSKDTSLFSFSDTNSLAFFTGAKDVRVEYVLRTESGRIVASDAKNLGKVGAGSTKDVTFTTGNLPSGSYTVDFVSDFQRCVFGVCSGAGDKITRTVEVPKLPLGEY